nr:response regulator [Deltaproteobacteria bacterium]
YTMIGDRERLIAEGCTHYIAKPFEKSAFLAIVKEAVFGRESMD